MAVSRELAVLLIAPTQCNCPSSKRAVAFLSRYVYRDSHRFVDFCGGGGWRGRGKETKILMNLCHSESKFSIHRVEAAY